MVLDVSTLPDVSGLTIGILFGLRGREVASQSKRLVLAIAVALSLISFAN